MNINSGISFVVRGDEQSKANIPQKLCVKGLKFSDKEYSFKERVIYIDTDEIRYYSKVWIWLTTAAERLLEK